jgi:hypothetical protein
MHCLNRSRLSWIFVLINTILFTSVYAAEPVRLKVKFEKGAVLREGPDIKSAKLATLKYGTSLELLETAPQFQVVQLAMPIEGRWLKVRYGAQIGYIFSALVENDELSKYECPLPKYSVKGIEMSRHAVKVEFCSDGTYILDYSYECMGPCWEHGCWRFSANKQLELLPQKTSATAGIGKPISCTHACWHKSYEIISKAIGPKKWQANQDMVDFGKYYFSKGKEPPGDIDWTYRKGHFTYRDSRH